MGIAEFKWDAELKQHVKTEYVWVTDLHGNKVHEWGSGRFRGISSFACINNHTCCAVLVADMHRVQAFRRDGLRLHVWTSRVCGEELGQFLHLACARDFMYVLERRHDRIDVFELQGPGRFAFAVLDSAQDLTCGPEEVYVMNPTQVKVYSALDGTELRSLHAEWSAHGHGGLISFSGLISYSYRENALLLAPISSYFGQPYLVCIYAMSAATGRIFDRTDFTDERAAIHVQEKSSVRDLRPRPQEVSISAVKWFSECLHQQPSFLPSPLEKGKVREARVEGTVRARKRKRERHTK